ncbi:alpha-ribazole phosphatase [Dendrosporobacter sp. 1207_IL3150]|uniref:alpha-ribazole phosphatase n=1 Tax=Dendrosporobacter sp. 1207_IL3150 TaxID=3084054 RepID=UPI002FDAC55B
MTKIILVRHGQTFWNLELKYQGHTDIELTDLGISQAKKVSQRLKDIQVSAIYASDLSRAYKTAEYIAENHKLPVIAVPEFREISFGEWEGLNYNKINEGWPDVMGKLFTHPDEIRIPGGETFRELKERAQRAIDELVAKHNNETIIVVSHGGTIRTLICAALDIHLNRVWNIKQDNTAVNIIEYYPERTMVSLINDNHHLNF